MRILLISNAFSTHTVRWVNALTQRGHEVHLAHIAGHEPEPHQVDPHVQIHRLPIPGPAGYYLNAGWLRRLVWTLRPDLSHVHYASGYGTLARLAGIPYVLSVWGSDVYEFPYRSGLNLRILQRNLQRASALTSTSECMARQVRKLLADPTALVTVIPFGVELARFDPDSVRGRVASGSFLIGNVKTLAEPYGIDVLIRAAGLLRERLPDLAFEVWVYGQGPLRPDLERLVTELKLDKVVRLAGPIPHDEVPHALAQFDIFCATSLRESFGVAVAEAMAMRRPVVVSDTEGFVEVVGDAGLTVPCSDALETANALARLATDPDLRESLGKAGRRRVETRYDWDVNVGSMIEFYEQVSRSR